MICAVKSSFQASRIAQIATANFAMIAAKSATVKIIAMNMVRNTDMRDKLKHALIGLVFRFVLAFCGGLLAFILTGKLIMLIWTNDQITAHGDLFLFTLILAGTAGWMTTDHYTLKRQRAVDTEIDRLDRQIEEERSK